MKKIYSSKIVFLLSAVYAPHILADATLKIDQDLSIGNIPVIPAMQLDGDTQYQIGSSQINMKTEHAVICNRIEDYNPISNVHIRITDPNGDNKGDHGSTSLLGVQSNVSFSIGSRTFNITTENRSKSICLTSPEFDVIFADRFGDPRAPESTKISYELIGAPPGGYAPGDDVRYDVIYVNDTAVLELVDMIEYYPDTVGLPAYYDGLSLLSCDILDEFDVDVGDCSSNNGVIKDVNLLPNHKIRLSVRRPVSSDSVVGEKIEMMAAVFPKVNTIDGVGSNHSFAGFDFISLKIPIVSGN